MDRQPTIQLVPDWPRIRKLVAEKLRKSEADVQAMADGDSLDRVELTMAIEETLGIRLCDETSKVDLGGERK